MIDSSCSAAIGIFVLLYAVSLLFRSDNLGLLLSVLNSSFEITFISVPLSILYTILLSPIKNSGSESDWFFTFQWLTFVKLSFFLYYYLCYNNMKQIVPSYHIYSKIYLKLDMHLVDVSRCSFDIDLTYVCCWPCFDFCWIISMCFPPSSSAISLICLFFSHTYCSF